MDSAEEELTESEKKQVAFGEMLMASKRELQAEARREYRENPEIQALHQVLIRKAQNEEKNNQAMNITKEKETKEPTEQEKKQIAFGRKLMAAKRKTQAEAERHLQEPETQVLLDELRKRLQNETK